MTQAEQALALAALAGVMELRQWVQLAAAIEQVQRAGFGQVAVTVNKGHVVHVERTISEYLGRAARPGGAYAVRTGEGQGRLESEGAARDAFEEAHEQGDGGSPAAGAVQGGTA